MFDNTCKYLAENFPTDFASWLLGKAIDLVQLSPQELSVEPIRVDTLILLQSDELVVHIEFQTDPDKKIPFRVTDYRLRGYRRFPEKEMYQVVVYLSKTTSPEVYKNTFTLKKLRHEFDVIRIWEQPQELFLQKPGLLPFAVLSNTSNKASTLQRVADEVEKLTERATQSDILACTGVLAGLVLEKEVIQKILRSDIMKESVIYQSIVEEGLQQGLQQKAEEIAANLLLEGVPIETIAKSTGLTMEKLLQLQAQNTNGQK